MGKMQDKIQKVFLLYIVAISFLFFSNQSNAQNKGFNPPGTSFGTNPFSQKPRTEGFFDDEEEFEEDEEEFEDLSDDVLRQRMEQRIKERGGTTNSAAKGSRVDFGSASAAVGATTTQSPSAKITSGAKNPACLKLDIDTGYGPDIITNFDFPDADIVEIAKTLGKLTCLNFILDKDVKGRISIVSNAPITVGDAWRAFLTALDVNGFSLIPSGEYLRIARQRDAKDKQIKTYAGEYTPDHDMYITRVVPLKHISAEEVSRVFRNFMPPNTRIVHHEQTNTIIITDTGSNIKKLVDMIRLLDVEGFDESLEVIRIKHASAQEISRLIDQLLPGSRTGGPATSGGAPSFRGGFSARRTKEGGIISVIIPDDRTNSVIISANAKGLAQVKILIDKLDTKISMSAGGSRIHVVYLQFADAEQVAQTLSNLAAGSSSKPTPSIAPAGGSSGTTAQLFEGAIKVAPDKATNSLVITANPSDFVTVKRVISKLDVPRDQVYVEAFILEITLDKTFELGTSVALPTSGIGFIGSPDFGNFLLNPLSVNGLVMGFRSGGMTSVTLPGSTTPIQISNLQGMVKALQQNSIANVLSTPQLLTLDNQEATIEVSENIPIPTTTTIQGAGTQQSITREKIALTLTIKPQINKISNFVKLEIKQKIEDISNRLPPVAVRDIAFSTTGRSSNTTVVVQDGDTVALGGLVRDVVTENATKVPILGDIPIFGWLFRTKNTATRKQNLVSLITPKIIKQYQDIRKVLDKKIRERDEFLEKNLGGDDIFEDYKHKLIKGLPPVSTLKNGERVESGEVEPGEEHETPTPPAWPPPEAKLESPAQAPLIPHQPPTPPPIIDGATAPGTPTGGTGGNSNMVQPNPPTSPPTNP